MTVTALHVSTFIDVKDNYIMHHFLCKKMKKKCIRELKCSDPIQITHSLYN